MGVTWSISHDDKLVVVQVEGEVKLEEAATCFQALIAGNAIPYRKLLDLSFAPLSQGRAGINAVGERARAVAATMAMGPVAVLVASELGEEMVQTFEQRVQLKRPLRIFRDIKAARAWLDEIAAP